MDETTVQEFSDFRFDIGPHREGLSAMAAIGLDKASMRAALIARNVVLFEASGTRFFVDVTNDPETERDLQLKKDCTYFVMLKNAESPEAAQSIRADIARYFLRHFPGRCLPQMRQASADGNFVYLACFS
ncbi:MAG TPA: hypothetical protein VFW40_09605 [Capsulimonadaceae bacterium]|nr:hypothetical protein [Capsulimonadaceae bacterium]